MDHLTAALAFNGGRGRAYRNQERQLRSFAEKICERAKVSSLTARGRQTRKT